MNDLDQVAEFFEGEADVVDRGRIRSIDPAELLLGDQKSVIGHLQNADGKVFHRPLFE